MPKKNTTKHSFYSCTMTTKTAPLQKLEIDDLRRARELWTSANFYDLDFSRFTLGPKNDEWIKHEENGIDMTKTRIL